MKFLQKASAIFSLALLPSLAMAECPYRNPNYKPGNLMVCQVPDGVYAMSNRLSGTGAASNYTVLLFVEGRSVRMLVKDKTSADSDFIVSPKHPKRRKRHGRHSMDGIQPQEAMSEASQYEILAEDEYWDDGGYSDEYSDINDASSGYAPDLQGIERRHHHRPGRPGKRHPHHRRPALCSGTRINICFGPDSKRAVAMPRTLTGSVELTVNDSRDALTGKVILNGAISSNNSVVLRKQNR